MPAPERKRRYAAVGRLLQQPGVDAAVLAKYQMAKSDAERLLDLLKVNFNMS